MIGWLKGTVQVKNPDSIILDVGGVGYQVSLSLQSFFKLPSAGGSVAMDIVTYVREDQISLFGFVVDGERAAFRHLNAVSGIGPKLALNILSGISPDELADAVSGQNLKRLQSIPGVGKRIAERILVELKDKMGISGAPQVPAAVGTLKADMREDLIQGLTALGYKKAEIDRVLAELKPSGAQDLEPLIREALRLLRPRSG